jgi:hypothetical protein
LEQWATNLEVFLPQEQHPEAADPVIEERLRALGYVE